METADELVARALAFGNDYPRHLDFVKRLVALVQKIDREFSGETRDSLLTNARSTFEHHLKIVKSTEETRRALEKLEHQHVRLTEALNELATVRPPGTTIH
jgi:hypothetical protein